MEFDEKESMRMVIQAVEVDSIDRVQDMVGRLIDLFNSDESREFLENKKHQARDGLLRVQNAMEVSLYEGMRAMRQLVTETRIHMWSGDTVVSRFQFNAQSIHYILTRATDVIKNDSLTNEEKIRTIWDGVTESLSLEEDEQTATQNLEHFLDSWRQNVSKKLLIEERERMEQQIRMDFDRGLRQQNSEIESFFRGIRKHFVGLKAKLQKIQTSIKVGGGSGSVLGGIVGGITGFITGGPAGVISGASAGAFRARKWADSKVKERGGERFLNRKDPAWYPRIENSLFDYIRCNMTDDELMKLIEDERLEEDLCHIREHLQGWISSCHDLLDQKKIPKLNKEAFVLEVRRMWAFAKALLLDDSEYIRHHSELLSKLINTALSSDDDVSPFISVARLPDGSRTLKLKLVVRDNADEQAVRSVVRDIAQVVGGRPGGPTPSSSAKGMYEYEINFQETDGINRFLGVLAKQTGKLAEVHVRAALLGEYDVNVGSYLTNPAFNRIYGFGLRAPGFMPTVFYPLDYSGEMYYCPNGWRRISINVADSAAEFDRRYGGWHVAYHGTNHELAATIVTSGFAPTQGAYSAEDEVVYFSPSIEYASHPRYAKVYEMNEETRQKKYVQMVFQVRINPVNIWKKVGGTLPGALDPGHKYYDEQGDNPPADPNFPDNRNLEWLVKPIPGTSGIDMFKDMFIIYGIMIRISDSDPQNDPANAWWLKKM